MLYALTLKLLLIDEVKECQIEFITYLVTPVSLHNFVIGQRTYNNMKLLKERKKVVEMSL